MTLQLIRHQCLSAVRSLLGKFFWLDSRLGYSVTNACRLFGPCWAAEQVRAVEEAIKVTNACRLFGPWWVGGNRMGGWRHSSSPMPVGCSVPVGHQTRIETLCSSRTSHQCLSAVRSLLGPKSRTCFFHPNTSHQCLSAVRSLLGSRFSTTSNLR